MRYARVTGLVLLIALSAAAQEPNRQAAQLARTVVVDLDVIDVSLDLPDAERMIKDKRQLERLIADGKARLVARVQMRGRSGELTSTRIGQRVPVRSSASGSPQIQYENTGLSVGVTPRVLEGDKIDVKLSIEITTVVINDNVFGPMFVQRTVNDVFTLKSGEAVVPLSVAQHEGLLPVPRGASKIGDSPGENFVIVMSARLLD